MKFTALGILPLLLASPVAAATVDLVTDGGFESGTSDNFDSDFTEVANSPGLAQFAVTTGAFGVTPRSGDYFMVINGDNNPNVDSIAWEQEVTVASGTEYTLGFSIADWSGTFPDANLSIRIGGVELLDYTVVAPSDTWVDVSTTWTSTLSGVLDFQFVELSSGFGGNDYTLDDISLTYETDVTAPIPLPASALLLFAGALGLAGLKRRSLRS
ncbi:VPLPA-CTERM sorting domain-containing protein [Primorskyibacter sp. S187A]|uniref:VPLPA-CTERM sorting domain-containing protein n=1 Tax=Primorskyibacter sp. S187A TaxID=3415130 RepID=UPI003C7AF643